ncbi:cyclase family protein [Acidisoma cladoniae]|jgi:kynurenine formamidase|uniref:cyclase family protein n=1 Tax=Acidisoma cladoniae TaxID=3040935 RepID=UPI0025514CC2|nr:cyclase family protein [Acidisoma sp. PAMC 29798]
MAEQRSDDPAESPALGTHWYPSRWGAEDQRGNGNLMGPEKIRAALALVSRHEIIKLGHPYDAQIPLAPGRLFGLRMPGGPTGGPHGGRSKTVWNDEFLATEIGQIGTHMDALGHLGRQIGEKADHGNIRFYNGNPLSEIWSPYGLTRLGIEKAPVFFTPGLLLDVQGLKGRVMDLGEEITPADLQACLERQGLSETVFAPGDAVLIRTGHGSRFRTEAATFYDGAPGLGLAAAEWLAEKAPSVVGADNFAVDVVPPVDPEVFHPVHQHLIMKHGIYLHEGMKLDELAETHAWRFAYIFAPLPIVGATGSPGTPIALI